MRAASLPLLLLTIGLSCRSSGGGREEGRPHVATITGISGAVEVLRGGSVDWAKLMKNAALYDDDRVRTFKGAWAQLAFTGGSTLRVDEESLIAIGPVSVGGGIVVERGTVEGELTPGLRVKTPSLEAENARGRDIVVQ
jgi:hypothetical protein